MFRRKRSNIEDYLRGVAAEWNGAANFGNPYDSPDKGNDDLEDIGSGSGSASEAEDNAPAPRAPPPKRASGGAGRSPAAAVARSPAARTPEVKFVTPGGGGSAKKGGSPSDHRLKGIAEQNAAEKKATKDAEARDREERSKTPDKHTRVRELPDGRIVYAGPRGGEYVLSKSGTVQFLSHMSITQRAKLGVVAADKP